MFAYLLNFLFILVTITLFITPFYGWYWLRHRPRIGSLHAFNLSLERFFSARQANYLVFAWACAEAVVWYVIPEFLLILVIFMRVHRKRQMVLYDIYGTIAGTVIAGFLSFGPSALTHVPYIQAKMVEQVQAWYAHEGIWALLHQPFSGVPYKVFASLVDNFAINIVLFMALAIIVRLARYLVIYCIALVAYPALHRYVYRNYLYLYVGTILVFSVLLYRVYLTFA